MNVYSTVLNFRSISTSGRTPPCEADERENNDLFEQTFDIDKPPKKKKKEKKAKNEKHSLQMKSNDLLQVEESDLKIKKKAKKEKKKKKYLSETHDEDIIASTSKKNKSKKEKKHKRKEDPITDSPPKTIKLEVIEQSGFGSLDQSLTITDVRTLKGEQDSIDLTKTQSCENSLKVASFCSSSMKESSSGFVPIQPGQTNTAEESFRTWLNTPTSSQTFDQQVNELLSFPKRGTKRKRTESRNSLAKANEKLARSPSSGASRLFVHDDVISSSQTEIIEIDANKNDETASQKPKLKRRKLEKNVAKPASDLISVSSDSRSDIFAIDGDANIQVPTLNKKVKADKKTTKIQTKHSASHSKSMWPDTETLVTPLNAGNDTITPPLPEHDVRDVTNSSNMRDNAVNKENVSSKTPKKQISYLYNPDDTRNSSNASSKKERKLLKQAEKEERRKEKEERKRLKEEKRALKAKKREEKLIRRLKRDEKRKAKEQRRKEKEDRRKLREERRKEKEQKRLLKEEKRLKKKSKKDI